jgi:8-oxo-dGTP pyrophosphatase MutT (NUDIX family)
LTVTIAAGNRHQLRRLIEERLKDSRPPTDPHSAVPAGFSAEVDAAVRQYFPASPAAAAVLVPLVDREGGLTVLLTQRATHLKNHAGQISFPGGRLEASDEGPLAAALRETEEEIGLSRQHVTFAGYLDPHLVLSGFWVTPVVGFVQPGFALTLDRSEVDATFEVPLLHILDPANHKARERTLGTTKVRVYDIPYGEHHIWGATAGMLIALYRLLNQ